MCCGLAVSPGKPRAPCAQSASGCPEGRTGRLCGEIISSPPLASQCLVSRRSLGAWSLISPRSHRRQGGEKKRPLATGFMKDSSHTAVTKVKEVTKACSTRGLGRSWAHGCGWCAHWHVSTALPTSSHAGTTPSGRRSVTLLWTSQRI